MPVTIEAQDSIFDSSNEAQENMKQATESFTAKQKYNQKRKQARKKKLELQKSKFKDSFWTLQENLKYIAFLKVNRQLFSLSVADRKKKKINILLSQCVGSRSADQCRSHHQKMLQYHPSFEQIIEYVQNQERQSKEKNQLTMLSEQSTSISQINDSRSSNLIQTVQYMYPQEQNLFDVLSFQMIDFL